jgi:2-polyprenyl-3-methyl-5-hydroxy-6-metoxy-1,4-benzoquinol methylase
MKNELTKTKDGYYSIKNLPLQQELEEYYSEKYYQNETIQYSHQYTKDELSFFNNTAEIAYHIYIKLIENQNHTLLEVGAGEGFFANFFYKKNWKITTLDYSDFGIKKHNKEILNTLVKGDIFKSLDSLIQEKSKYSFINLSNVLEHVLDPIELLNKFKLLLSDNSILRISVPNDYSNFQQFLLDQNYTSNTWLCPPDHLHYFTFESLSNLLISLEYQIELKMGEFPIELYLSNSASNYVNDRSNGKYAHRSRVEVDNFLFNEGIEKYINFYKACADIGLSRQVVIYAKLKKSKINY